MPNFCKRFVLLFALLTFATMAHAKDDGRDKDRAVITADYILVDIGYENKDADAATAFLTDNFTEIENDGGQSIDNKVQQRDIISKILFYASHVSSHTIVKSIVFTKTGATVTYLLDLEIELAAGEKTAMAIDTSTASDTWIKSGDTWLVQQTKTLVKRGTFDGKPN